MKFIRNYLILVQNPQGETLEIKPPFSIKFDITRNTLASANSCSLSLYNLSPSTRNRLYKDRYEITNYWQIIIKAGYRDLKTVFQGNIYEANSSKQGTEYITKIDCFDGFNGIQNGFISETVSAKTSKASVFRKIINTMPNVIAGTIGSQGDETTGPRGEALMGQSSEVLGTQTQGNYFIDNEVVNILEPDEVLSKQVLILDSKELITTPKRSDTFLECPILFYPDANVGVLCEVRSRIEIYNGQYKTMGFKHSYTYMNNSVGSATTIMSLYIGANGLREVA